MDKHEEERQPFNERAALEQLEQFQNDIERYRQQRKAVGEEFEHFVKSFKTAPSRDPQAPPPAAARPAAPRPPEPRGAEASPSPAPPASRISVPAPPPAQARPVEAARSPAAEPAPLPRKTPDASAVAEPRIEPRAAVSTPAPTERMSAERAHGKTGRPSPVAILAMVLLAAGIAAWYFWPQQTDDTVAPPATVTAPPPQTTTPAPAQPATPPTPAPATPSTETVVTTLGPVWLRVIADGVKIREDEVPAGTRIPVDVKKTLVIRTGNAAAVSLVLKGKDLGALGAEGQVVTRTFTVPER